MHTFLPSFSVKFETHSHTILTTFLWVLFKFKGNRWKYSHIKKSYWNIFQLLKLTLASDLCENYCGKCRWSLYSYDSTCAHLLSNLFIALFTLYFICVLQAVFREFSPILTMTLSLQKWKVRYLSEIHAYKYIHTHTYICFYLLMY